MSKQLLRALAKQVNTLLLDAIARERFQLMCREYLDLCEERQDRPSPLPFNTDEEYDIRQRDEATPPRLLCEDYAILAAIHETRWHGGAQPVDASPFTPDADPSMLLREVAWEALLSNAMALKKRHSLDVEACLERVQKDLETLRTEATSGQASDAKAANEPTLRLSEKMKEILRVCRQQHYKGQTLANKVGLEFNYARKVFSKLVKAGLLKNDPEKGYRTIRR